MSTQKFLVSAHFSITLDIVRHQVENYIPEISIKVVPKAKHFKSDRGFAFYAADFAFQDKFVCSFRFFDTHI